MTKGSDRVQVGIEHEYVATRSGRRIDFRRVIHRTQLPGVRANPGDVNAYRLVDGVDLTCDGPEAEVASPPIVVRPGFGDEVVSWAGVGGRVLRRHFPHLRFEGVSTHISVGVPDEHAVAVGGMFARTFAPALMLLAERADSEGLLIRPRTGRVEYGLDFVTASHLEAAVALAVGGTLACLGVAAGVLSRNSLPNPVSVDIVAAVDRWGWYVDRTAFGPDLYL